MRAGRHAVIIRMGASMRKTVFVSALYLSSVAWADFAPMQAGNQWEYSGTFSGYIYPFGRPLTQRNFQEHLSLNYISSRISVDTLLHTLNLRDSVFQRTENGLAAADTVLRQTITLAERNNLFSIRSVVGDTLLSYEPIFFLASQLPDSVQGASVLGVYNGYSVVAYSGSSGFSRPTQSWYVDSVGLFWSREQWFGGCGESYVHRLQLSAFNRQVIDLGIQPPLGPMPKAAKTTCTEIQPREMGIVLEKKNEGSVLAVDAVGRLYRDWPLFSDKAIFLHQPR